MEVDFERLLKERNAAGGFLRLLGVRTVEASYGHAVIELAVEEKHLNPFGAVHGGCLYSLCDTASGVCALACGVASVTSTGSIQYLRPAMHVQKLIAEATLLKGGKRLLINEVTVCDENGLLLAKATITQCILEGNQPPAE